MPTHKWKFKSHFRKQAYGWKGTSLASKRMREAVSEIKKVAKNDPALAGEGIVELFCRLYPALMQIDGSSSALGITHEQFNQAKSLSYYLQKGVLSLAIANVRQRLTGQSSLSSHPSHN